MKDKRNNCISYWYPRLKRLEIKIPETIIVEAENDLSCLLDGEKPKNFFRFIEKIKKAVNTVGYPAFLRSGHISGKHDFRNTCFLTPGDDVIQHIINIVEEANCFDFMGLPTHVWAVREYLQGYSPFTAFKGMLPIRAEARLFIDKGEIISFMFYWPKEAIQFPSMNDWEESLENLNETVFGFEDHLREETKKIAKEFNGFWSVDWMLSDKGFYCIDMAIGERSWGNPKENNHD